MKGRSIVYTAEELAWIEERQDWPRAALHAAFVTLFSRSDVSEANLTALCKRKGWLTGRTGCFTKGAPPHNKGRPCAPGTGGRHPNAQRTHFRKGERRGVAVKLYKPIGTERLSKEGYVERKIHDGMPLQSRWRAVHLIRWEAAHGPLPKGHVLKCMDGDRTNTDPTNWECVPRALLPRLNGGNRHRHVVAFDDAPADLKPTLLAVAKLDHRARTLRKGDVHSAGGEP